MKVPLAFLTRCSVCRPRCQGCRYAAQKSGAPLTTAGATDTSHPVTKARNRNRQGRLTPGPAVQNVDKIFGFVFP